MEARKHAEDEAAAREAEARRRAAAEAEATRKLQAESDRVADAEAARRKAEAEGRGYTLFKQLQVHSIITIWYAPKVKRFVKYTAQSFEHDLPLELSTFELVEYRVTH